jgi:hypothetical protein
MNEIINSINKQMEMIKAFIGEEAISLIMKAGSHISTPHKANSEKFYDEYVLNDSDFPLVDNKYYQATTELSARLNNLISKIKEYKDLELDIESLGVDIEILDNQIDELKFAKKTILDGLNIKKLLIDKEKKQNEISLKEYSIGFLRSDINEVYSEFVSWENLAEKYSKECKLSGYGIAREAAMEIKKEFLRMSVKPEDAKGGEVPIVYNWKKINQLIINNSRSELLFSFKKAIDQIEDK